FPHFEILKVEPKPASILKGDTIVSVVTLLLYNTPASPKAYRSNFNQLRVNLGLKLMKRSKSISIEAIVQPFQL
ncbi:MAG: hypothetical protein IT245_05040, partial [Bacteroidia bacterium]|nr:hypothetical protein [Bacteroidia bacterium]